MDWQDLLELSKTRKEKAILRKNKREFIAMERSINLKEMEKRAKIDILPEKTEPIAQVELLDINIDENDEAEVKKIRAHLVFTPEKEERKHKEGKTKQYMGRFRKAEIAKEDKTHHDIKVAEPILKIVQPSFPQLESNTFPQLQKIKNNEKRELINQKSGMNNDKRKKNARKSKSETSESETSESETSGSETSGSETSKSETSKSDDSCESFIPEPRINSDSNALDVKIRVEPVQYDLTHTLVHQYTTDTPQSHQCGFTP